MQRRITTAPQLGEPVPGNSSAKQGEATISRAKSPLCVILGLVGQRAAVPQHTSTASSLSIRPGCCLAYRPMHVDTLLRMVRWRGPIWSSHVFKSWIDRLACQPISDYLSPQVQWALFIGLDLCYVVLAMILSAPARSSSSSSLLRRQMPLSKNDRRRVSAGPL